MFAQALRLLRLQLRLGQRGQQHRRQDRDDGDDHEQFNQGECFSFFQFQM